MQPAVLGVGPIVFTMALCADEQPGLAQASTGSPFALEVPEHYLATRAARTGARRTSRTSPVCSAGRRTRIVLSRSGYSRMWTTSCRRTSWMVLGRGCSASLGGTTGRPTPDGHPRRRFCVVACCSPQMLMYPVPLPSPYFSGWRPGSRDAGGAGSAGQLPNRAAAPELLVKDVKDSK